MLEMFISIMSVILLNTRVCDFIRNIDPFKIDINVNSYLTCVVACNSQTYLVDIM